jgi:hypothetical protein
MNYRVHALHDRNCNHYADAIARALLGRGIPSYVNRLAYLGGFLSCLLPSSLTKEAPVDRAAADGGGGGGGGGSVVRGPRAAAAAPRGPAPTAFAGDGRVLSAAGAGGGTAAAAAAAPESIEERRRRLADAVTARALRPAAA